MYRPKKTYKFKQLFALITLLVLIIIFSLFGKRFFSTDMMLTIVESSYSILTMALGLTFIIITGGIDLSLGAVAMCGAIVAGVASTKWGLPLWVGLSLIPVLTTLFGCLNGFLIAYCGLQPFIATLGTQMLATGVGYIVSEVQTIRFPTITSAEGWFKRVFFKTVSGVPIALIYIVILILLAWFLLTKTRVGKYACAIGSNKEAARLSGVNVRKWQMGIYAMSGIFTAFSALYYVCVYSSILPGSGAGQETDCIAAIVIGGTSMAGGAGSIWGTVVGVFSMSVLKTGLLTVGLRQQWQVLFTGLVLIGAILLDVMKFGKGETKKI